MDKLRIHACCIGGKAPSYDIDEIDAKSAYRPLIYYE